MSDRGAFRVPGVAEAFTYQETSFDITALGGFNIVIADGNPRRYAIGFYNLTSSGALYISTRQRETPTGGVVVPVLGEIWLNIKDHGPLPFTQWWVIDSVIPAAVTVFEIIQLP